ncbi:PREDICTED: uncharacterized protein LOC105112382 [Populus euphratica]|uniref:Uncharacterized protein LOC105112382 n=1 Tax=Populus euphratica TaxID=75702 RepID=A0AAJ6X5R0_POPEU|nr:PREDICTED: uncharacterized protein LOC105112382 [Populus euphratica]
MTDFKDTLAKLTSALSFQEKGKFPSQTQQNPKGQYNANASSSGSQHMDQVKSVTTLRSGKVIEKPSIKPYEKDDESISEGKEGVESENCKETTDSPPALPFPQAMTKQRKVNHNSEIFEIFKQVRINIPLLDAIKQVPSYAKFLKDLCIVKRKLNVKKKAFLAEQVSAILQNNNALKYKDPGCPTISCFIGEQKIERALLDLGASVNLLPYSVFQSLNLGELKPTSISLLLADRSVKVPRGIIEDVLVQVDKFIYPVDFIVLDTKPVEACNSFPINLGHSFLATSNALINYRNGLMKLSFRNMTLEMNIFNICKQPRDDNDLQEVDHIDELVYDQLESTLSKNELDESEDLQMIYSKKVFFYNSQLYSFPRELRSRWNNPYGAYDIENSMNDNVFKNAITKIYRARCARLRLLMNHGIPEDIRWLIKAKDRLSCESSNSFISHMSRTGKSTFVKKHRAKRLKVCHRCARWTCNTQCRSLGMVSINREDKIQFIKDGLSKESLDNLLLTLETHPSGDVHRAIHDLWPHFHKEHDRLSLGNLTKKYPVYQFLRKLDGKPIPDP